MNATLLRVLAAAAGRSIEQGTLVEIIATATRLMALIKPLITEADLPDLQRTPPRTADQQGR